jgi:hypothetical protein
MAIYFINDNNKCIQHCLNTFNLMGRNLVSSKEHFKYRNISYKSQCTHYKAKT